jgi:signal transduction histidine kinase/ActR/RegA family two-component response regulator
MPMNKRSNEPQSPRGGHGWLLRYGCAVVSVATALYGTNALGESTAGVAPLFFAAVAVSAWFGGLFPGLLATFLAGLASAFFLFEPVYSLRLGWDDVIRVAVFTLVATLIGLLQEASRRAHLRAAEATEEALAASRAKDKFLAVVSHELRNPLNPILTVAGVLASDERLPDDVREDMKMVRRNAELEARLVDDLLDLNRIVRGKLALCLDVIPAHPLIDEAVAMCEADAAAKGVELEVRLAADRHHVYADAGRLRQVMWNLLRNALKFTPAGGRIVVTTSTAADESLRIAVTDTGIGIEADALGRIFASFEQADESVTRRFGGLGLGLAIAKSLVESQRGSLHAESPGKGRGATFTVLLPTVDPPDDAGDSDGGASAAERTRPRQRSASGLGGDALGNPMRILLVEDHLDTARAVCRLLRGGGHDVTAVASVAESIRAAGECRYELLICDIDLPDGSGLDVVRRAKLGGAPSIALSGHATADEWRKSFDAGFDEYLTKPVSAETLESAIRRLVMDPSRRRHLRLARGG